jgi:hypothetical protein
VVAVECGFSLCDTVHSMYTLLLQSNWFIEIHGILYRLTITGYLLKSIGDFLLQLHIFGAAIEFNCQFAVMDYRQKIILPDVLLLGKTFDGLKGFCAISKSGP